MLVYLSLLVCTLSTDVCHVTVPPLDAFVGVAACQISGMQNMPLWEHEHPGMYVSKVRCTPGKRPVGDDQA